MKTAIALAALLQVSVAQTFLGQRFQWPAGDNTAAAGPAPAFPEHKFSIPVDHFHNDSKYAPHCDDKFDNRYWFDDTHYKPGGPVFFLMPGEADGTLRLPIMQKGIIKQLSEKYNGMSVVFEHRYFGTSQPRKDLSTENLRFLTTDQALEDAVYFAKNIVFPGHENDKLTAADTQWIAYGGSYAGAFVAFLRTLYPGVFYGAISSSGVTEAIYDYWQYYEPIRRYADPKCVSITQQLTSVVDGIITGPAGKNKGIVTQLKTFFGLNGISYLNDFAQTISLHVSSWQARNWDPAINDPTFDEYCSNVTSTKLVKAPTFRERASALFLLLASGHRRDVGSLTTPLLNYANYVNKAYSAGCAETGQTLDECFSTHNTTFYHQQTLNDASWRSWPYMYCTQWGYLQTGSGVPKGQFPLISRTIDIPYLSIICKEAFGITTPPDTDGINRRGGFDLKYPRVALIGGETDPWREATPLAEGRSRPSTDEEPTLVIKGAVHHWDENGVEGAEVVPGSVPPSTIVDALKFELDFVGKWLDEAKRPARR